MLLGFFKPNQTLPNFIIPVVVAVLWIPAFMQPNVVLPADAMPLYAIVASFLSKLPHGLVAFLAITLVTLQAIYFNYIFVKHEVLFRKNNIPLIVYVLLVSLTKSFLVINPILLANTVLLFVVDRTFRLYKNNNPLPLIFDICTLLAIASLFYFPVVILLLMMWFSLFILRPFIWREWIVGIFGFFVPYLFLSLYYFWKGHFLEFTRNVSQNLNFSFHVDVSSDPTVLTLLLLIALFFLLAIWKLQANFYKNVIRTRGYQQVLILMLIISSLSFMLGNEVHLYDFTITVIPLSFFISYYFLAAKRVFWSELLFSALVVMVIYNHFN